MQCVIFATIAKPAVDGTIISALVAFGAAGPVLAMAYLLIANQKAERKENAEAQAIERKSLEESQAEERVRLQEWMKRLQDQLVDVSKDKSLVIKDNTEAMMGLKIEMTRLVDRLSWSTKTTGESIKATSQLSQKLDEIKDSKNHVS